MSNGRSQRLSDEEFNGAVQRLDELVREFETLPYPAVQEKIFEALQAIDAIHREAIARLISAIIEQGHTDVIARAVHDPVMHTLLVLYDLVASDDLPEIPTPENSRNFVPLDQLAPVPHRPQMPVFQEVARAADVPAGTMQAFPLGDTLVLIANVSGDFYAVRDTCPSSVAPLHLGAFTPPIVVCPWHNEAFDIRTGKRADGGSGPALGVLPVTVSDGVIKVALRTDVKASGPNGANRLQRR